MTLPTSPAKPTEEGSGEGQDNGQKRWHQPNGYHLSAGLTIFLAAASGSPGPVAPLPPNNLLNSPSVE